MLVISLKPGESVHFIDKRDSAQIKLTFREHHSKRLCEVARFSLQGSCAIVKECGWMQIFPDGCNGIDVMTSGSIGELVIARDINVKPLRHERGTLRIGITAPQEVLILRDKHIKPTVSLALIRRIKGMVNAALDELPHFCTVLLFVALAATALKVDSLLGFFILSALIHPPLFWLFRARPRFDLSK